MLVQGNRYRCKPTHRVPGHNTAQVRADRVEAIVLDAAVVSDNEVSGIALQGMATCNDELLQQCSKHAFQ